MVNDLGLAVCASDVEPESTSTQLLLLVAIKGFLKGDDVRNPDDVRRACACGLKNQLVEALHLVEE